MAYGLTKCANFVVADSQSLNVQIGSLLPTTTLTLEASIKFANFASEQDIISKWGDASLAYCSWQLYANASSFGITISNGGGAGNVSVDWSPSTYVWYHLAVTFSSGEVKFYVNGVQQGTTQTCSVTSINQASGYPLWIGGNRAQDTHTLNGRVSLARMWSVVRSASELSANICNVFGAPTSGLVAEWSLDNVLTDASGNGLTFTNNGGVTFPTDIPSVCAISAPTVTTQAVSDITTTTATGNGNVTADGGASITERGVCWGASANPTTSGSHASTSGTTGAFTVDITGLLVGTHYHLRAYAINSTGTSYGEDVEFDTESAPPWRFENLNGLEFDPDDKKTIFAERLNEILDRLHDLDGLEPDPEL